MYGAQVLLFLAAGASASILAERVPFGAIEARTVLQGWSLQASTCPAGSQSCGSGSCCPSSLTCGPAANDIVIPCCTSGDCRGAVEGSPNCADSSWSLFKGLNGNGFCCLPGMVGIYDFHNNVAGTCVSSAAADATLAVPVSSGSGTATVAPVSTTAAVSSTAATSAVASSTAGSGAGTSAASSATAASNATITGSTSTTTAIHSGVEKAGMSLAALTIALVALFAF